MNALRARTPASSDRPSGLAARPDAIFIAASGSPAVLPNVTLRDRGFSKPLYNAPVAVGQDFLRLGGAKVEGVLAAAFLVSVAGQVPDSNPSKKVVVDFVEKFSKLYPTTEPDTQNPTAYDSGIVLSLVATEALKVAKPGTEQFQARDPRSAAFRQRLGRQYLRLRLQAREPYGVQSNSLVIATVKGGKWTYLSN